MLDLRAPAQQAPTKSSNRKRKKVDFLTLVEHGEDAVSDKMHGWFSREKKAPKVKVVATPVEKIESAISPLEQRRNTEKSEKRYKASQTSGKRSIAFGPSVRFAAAIALVAIAVFGARYIGRVQVVRGNVLGASTEALQKLIDAGAYAQALQFGVSQDNLQAASTAFQTAQHELESVAGVLANAPGLGKVKRAQNLLHAGEAIAEAAKFLASGAETLQNQPSTAGLPINGVLQVFDSNLKPAASNLQSAAELLKTVEPNDLPEQYRQVFSDLQAQLPSLQLQFQRLVDMGDFLRVFLAVDGTSKRYLFAFQNTNELRPTGGFIGSVAIVDVVNGGVDKIEVPSGGVYDLSGQTTMRVAAPEPLRLVMANWNLQDSNWFPDFPTSAKKMLQFYDSSGAPKVDGVVAVTPAVIQSFLELTGPVEVPEVQTTFTAETFPRQLEEIIKQSETKDYTKPKLVLGYLAPKVISRAFALPQDKLWQLLGKLQQHVVSRDIIFYAINPDQQAKIEKLGWGGAILSADKDYIMVNHANIGGGKTDGVMDEFVRHEALITGDGTVTDTVTIVRVHHGTPGDKFTGDPNVSYTRVYVPAGSTFLSATGFSTIDPKRFQAPSADRQPDADLTRLDNGAVIDDVTKTRISQEFGKAVFGNWMVVGPSETTKATFTYVLPFKLTVGGLLNRTDEYSMLAQMQPGTRIAFSSELHVPASWQAKWQGSSAPVFESLSNGTARMNAVLDRDYTYGLVLGK